ncbi:uncharacterized protein V6R79_009183 [Siganus canaliculatus]
MVLISPGQRLLHHLTDSIFLQTALNFPAAVLRAAAPRGRPERRTRAGRADTDLPGLRGRAGLLCPSLSVTLDTFYLRPTATLKEK